MFQIFTSARANKFVTRRFVVVVFVLKKGRLCLVNHRNDCYECSVKIPIFFLILLDLQLSFLHISRFFCVWCVLVREENSKAGKVKQFSALIIIYFTRLWLLCQRQYGTEQLWFLKFKVNRLRKNNNNNKNARKNPYISCVCTALASKWKMKMG